METIFMNTENSKTSKPHRFRLELVDKLNLKNLNKRMALANWVFITLGKTSNQNTRTINLKFLLQLGMKLLIYLMFLTLLMIFRIILNSLLQKHETLTEDLPIEIYPKKIQKQNCFRNKDWL